MGDSSSFNFEDDGKQGLAEMETYESDGEEGVFDYEQNRGKSSDTDSFWDLPI